MTSCLRVLSVLVAFRHLKPCVHMRVRVCCCINVRLCRYHETHVDFRCAYWRVVSLDVLQKLTCISHPRWQRYGVLCDPSDENQKLTFDSGMVRWGDMCLDGACANLSTGCAPLRFRPCSLDLPTMKWTHGGGSAPFENTAPSVPGCLDLWGSGAGPEVGLCPLF